MRRLSQYIAYLKILFVDLVRSKGCAFLSSQLFVMHVILRVFCIHNSYEYLMAAHRCYPGKYVTEFIYRRIGRMLADTDRGVVAILDESAFEKLVRRSIVLKEPVYHLGEIEKGVMVIKYTEIFALFHKYVDCDRLLEHFYLVLEPSWSGYCDLSILSWIRHSGSKIIIQASEKRDYDFIENMESNLVPVSFGASDWVDYRTFRPLPSAKKKKYDVIYVANYGMYKRHHLLFRAIKGLRETGYKAVLVFGKWGTAKSDIIHLINYFGIGKSISIYEDLTHDELNEILNGCKVNVLLSLKEGSNKSIFEGFFANVPGLVLKDNIGVNKSYINVNTGKLVDENELRECLSYFRENWTEFRPRQWALENISPLVTTKRLSDVLQNIAKQNGEKWTRDIVPKVNSPELNYFLVEDAKRIRDSKYYLSRLVLRKKTEQSQGSGSSLN